MSELADLERLAFLRRPEALPALQKVLLALATRRPVDSATGTGKEDLSVGLATRIAAAAAAVLLDPNTPLRVGDYAQLAPVHSTIANSFLASGFGGSEHLLRQFAERAAGDIDAYLRFFALFSIDSAVELDLAEIFSGPPDAVLLTYLKLLAQKPVASLRGHARRDALCELDERLPLAGRLPATMDHIVLLANAWMLCSYAEHPRKHRLKQRLNPVMRDCLARLGLRDAAQPARRLVSARPTLVVASEIMHSNHVQYRYFGQYLRQLRSGFRTLLVTDRREVDEHVKRMFDEVRVFERRTDGSHLAAAARLIQEAAPDLLYYPSVGMRHWGVALANLRLAPIQLMGLGHTATSFCETIDYCIAEAGLVSSAEVWHETMVLIPDEAHILERSPHYLPVAPAIRERAAVVRIALASNLLKLNPRFLAFLAKLRADTRRPLEFHIFPNVSGHEFAASKTVVGQLLPGAAVTVHPLLAYNRYLARLNQCDISLSPFPFGGMHSTIDSIRQGLPVVALEGVESHSRTDAMLLRRLGMPDWLICKSESAYAAAALRLIEDDRLRVEVSRYAAGCGVDRKLYSNAVHPARAEMVDAIRWIYAHHEAIQKAGRRVWSSEDRRGFSA